ncbi:MAG: nuclear transport factor 2 family protein [Sporichthyaceae bacterium]
MAEHPNALRIRSAYAKFATGDLPAVLETFAPDAVFHVGGEGPNAGDYKGRAAIGEQLVNGARETGGSQRFEIRGVFADDRHAVVATRETATRARDGAVIDVEEVHLMTLDPDGRIVGFWDIPADPDAHNAFFDGR